MKGSRDRANIIRGLDADESAIAAQHVPVRTVSVGSVTREGESHADVIEPATSSLSDLTVGAMQEIACNVVKIGEFIESQCQSVELRQHIIGALFSEEAVKVVSKTLRQGTQLKAVLDVEPFFKAGPAPSPGLITALRRDVLPSVTILSATVPEAKALLDNAGVPIDYPKSMQDVVTMANALCKLGPEYAIIKREVLEEESRMTVLHYILCGSSSMEPVVSTSRFENPKGMFGASYSIPRTSCVIRGY